MGQIRTSFRIVISNREKVSQSRKKFFRIEKTFKVDIFNLSPNKYMRSRNSFKSRKFFKKSTRHH